MTNNEMRYMVESTKDCDAWTELKTDLIEEAKEKFWELVENEIRRPKKAQYGAALTEVTEEGGDAEYEIIMSYTADDINQAIKEWEKQTDKLVDAETDEEARAVIKDIQDGWHEYPAMLEHIYKDDFGLNEKQERDLTQRINDLCDNAYHSQHGRFIGEEA